MKTLSMLLCGSALMLVLQAHSCNKHKPDHPSACGDIACTMMFAMVTVEIKDNAGKPVLLDEYYTIREKNGEKITSQSHNPESGTYVVLDDGFISTLTNKRENFRFIGKKNGAEVVNEAYDISGDCCHVNKESGKSAITIP